MLQPNSIDAILLDIEGTTTPVDYVFGVLFPFAKERVGSFLQEWGQDEAVQADLQQLRQEYEADRSSQSSASVPNWELGDTPNAVPYIHYLISIDRKSTGLKSLQGKIWDQGYQAGTLRSQIFPDVQPALERWTSAGKKVFIFSSGSIQAQQLLFRYSQVGDLTRFLSGYFDTQVGNKRDMESYRSIGRSMQFPSPKILFISDVAAELRAAQAAEMQTLFSCRPGNPATDPEGFTLIQTFDGI